MTVSLEYVREVLDYDPNTGLLHWKVRTAHRIQVGDLAGCWSSVHGYVLIGLRGRVYPAHRLAWFHYYGAWPSELLDHRNGVRSDNRIGNLREVSDAGNSQNRGMDRRNKSGFPGVSWDSQRGLWFASIAVGGKTRALGRHKTKEEAYRAYLAAKAVMHPAQPVPRWEIQP